VRRCARMRGRMWPDIGTVGAGSAAMLLACKSIAAEAAPTMNLFLPLRSGGRCRLRRQDAEANGEAGPQGVPQERHVTRKGRLLLLTLARKAPPSALRARERMPSMACALRAASLFKATVLPLCPPLRRGRKIYSTQLDRQLHLRGKPCSTAEGAMHRTSVRDWARRFVQVRRMETARRRYEHRWPVSELGRCSLEGISPGFEVRCPSSELGPRVGERGAPGFESGTPP
jgi:hypothetical protein